MTYQAPRPVVGQRVQIWFRAKKRADRRWLPGEVVEADKHVEWMNCVRVRFDVPPHPDLPDALVNWSPEEVRAEDGSPLFGAPTTHGVS